MTNETRADLNNLKVRIDAAYERTFAYNRKTQYAEWVDAHDTLALLGVELRTFCAKNGIK